MIPARNHLDYALGYIDLGLLAEARRELACLAPEDRETPEALAVRLELGMAASTWTRVIALARRLTAVDPEAERPWIARAYSLRELGRTEEARDVLLRGEQAIDRPGPLVDYNLACYHCLLGDLDEARRRLARACDTEPGWREEARRDPDLAALHPSS